MSLLKIKMFEEDGVNEGYLETLYKALPSAGNHLNEFLRFIVAQKKRTFLPYRKSEPTFAWLQTSILPFGFQHLCFSLGMDVFSVLFAIGDMESGFFLRENDLKSQLEICRNNDMIPTIMPLYSSEFKPAVDGFHLIYSDSKELVKPQINLEPRPMSHWEKLDFGIQMVRSQIEKEGGVVKGYTSTPGIEPNLWFEKDGRQCFAIVVYLDDAMCKLTISSNVRQLMRKCDGFYAFFSFPEVYRGQGFFVKSQILLKPLADLLEKAK